MDIKKQILIGSLLGDGGIVYRERIEKGKKANYLRKSIGYSETHSLKQKEYLLWKNKYLKFSVFENKTKIMISKGDNKNFLFRKFLEGYVNHRKTKITKDLLYELNEVGVLVWYLDDGTFTYPRIDICTDTFNYETQKLFCQFFKDKFNISPKIIKIKNFNRRNGTYNYAYRIHFNSKELRKLLNVLIKTFLKYGIPKYMFYKLDLKKQLERFEDYNHKYYLKNKEIIKKRAREWEKSKKGKECKAKYREKNREKLRKINRVLREKNKDKYNKNRNKIRRLRKEKGLCTMCGNKKINKDFLWCEKCREKRRIWDRKLKNARIYRED